MNGDFINERRAAIPELQQYCRDIFAGLAKRLDFSSKHSRAGSAESRFKGKGRSVNSFDLCKGAKSFQVRRSGKKHPKSRKKTYGRKRGVVIKGLGFCAFKGDDLPEGDIKGLTVKRTARRIEFSFMIEVDVPDSQSDMSDRPIVGIDLGQKDMIVTSTGERIPGRERDLRRVKALQKKLDGQVEGSSGYRKTQRLIAKESQRIAESEKGFLHRTTTDLKKRHGPNFADGGY